MALVAVDVLGLSYREAARALRVREATITTRLFRARKQVAKQLAPDPEPSGGENPPPDGLAPPPRRGQPAKARREQMRASGVLPSRDLP